MKGLLVTVISVLFALGPVIVVIVALGTRREARSRQFWFRVGTFATV